MGLAAGQARLLTITGRKSDCEYQSMKLSHQKIALARELADLSNEYQNSLDQTKLIYDYYGKGDTSTQLSYGILMNPSALNDYMPITVTDSMGRITLNSKYANVARKAGIPQEGLGTLPSENIRNKFIEGLVGEGLITEDMGTKIMDVPYNQNAGFGGAVTVATKTQEGNYSDLLKYIEENCTDSYDLKNITNGVNDTKTNNGAQDADSDELKSTTLHNLLTSHVIISACGQDGDHWADDEAKSLANNLSSDASGLFAWLEDELSKVLGVNTYAQQALAYATKQMSMMFDTTNYTNIESISGTRRDVNNRTETKKCRQGNIDASQNLIGFSFSKLSMGPGKKNRNPTIAIDLSNLAQAYLTHFADYMNGISKVDEKGIQVFDVNKGQTIGSHLAKDNKTYQYIFGADKTVSSDDMAQATFYDTLFNQICANGWTENNQIEDKTYLQQMLQSGMLYLSKAKDDGYYYQENYATDSYIKEIEDDTKVAQAEAKYTTEKAKLNAKEETLDLKMKNLDTEISSLSTEYDTVKNAISKNIEKSFKRYNA